MSRRSFVLLFLLLIATRALLVLSLADVFFYGEELAKGAAAKLMLDRIGVPHHTLSYGYHEGGGFVITHLKALAFLLVGPNVLAHKLVAIVTTSILLTVGVWFSNEHFGRRAALIFGVLFVFCPAAWLRFSLLDLGTHYEALIFLMLILHFTFRIVFREEARVSDYVGLGLAAGFGLYFSLQCAPMIGLSGLYLLAAQRARFFNRKMVIAALAFVIGATPLLMMMSQVGRDAIVVRGHESAGAEAGQGTSFGHAFIDLFETLRIEGDPFAWIMLFAYPILIALGFAFGDSLGARRLRLKSALILVYVALFMLLYLASGLAVGIGGHWFFFLRLSSLWFFSTLVLAACAANLAEIDLALVRRLAIGIVAGFVLSGVIALARLVHAGHPGHLASNWHVLTKTKGYDYAEYFNKFQFHFDGDEADRIAIMMRAIDDPLLLAPAVSTAVFEHTQMPLDAALALCRRAFGEHWHEGMLGLGHFVDGKPGYDVRTGFARVAGAPDETRPLLAEAIGRAGLGPRFLPEKIAKLLALEIDPLYRTDFVHGAGYRIYRAFVLDPDAALTFIASCALADREALLVGYRAACAANSLE